MPALNYIEMRNGKNKAKALTRTDRLASFDQATERQRTRNLLAVNAGVGSRTGDRDWTREDLYARGYKRTPDCK